MGATGQIGSRQHLQEGALGVSLGCRGVLWGLSTPNPTQVSWKPLMLNSRFSLCACGYVVDWPNVACGPDALLVTIRASFGKTGMLLGTLPDHGKRICGLLKIVFYPLWGKKSGAWGKKQCFGGVLALVRGSRPETKTGNNQNGSCMWKQDPIVAQVALKKPPTVLLNIATVPVDMAICAINRQNFEIGQFFKVWVEIGGRG